MSRSSFESSKAPSNEPPVRRDAARWPIVAVLIISLLLTGLMRDFAASRRLAGRVVVGSDAPGAAQGSRQQELSSLDSFALALVLGGLRGPLVMILWSTSETQKADRDLNDFNTKIEWIRLLQPEFDSVHIFQIWNKAYNVSVQMATIANKYRTVLDALDYAHSVDRERPNNLAIIEAIGGIYADKLGGSTERDLYRKRLFAESLPHASHQRARRGEAGWQRLELDQLVDADGNILPQFLQPRGTPLGDAKNRALYYDGSEMQFLPQFAPYRYGVSAMALGYNYEKRGQLLYRLAGASHPQLADMIIDSRPAMALKGWSEECWDIANRAELDAFRIAAPPPPVDRVAVEMLGVKLPLGADGKPQIADRAKYDEAIFFFDRCGIVAAEGYREFNLHVDRFKFSASPGSNMDGLPAMSALTDGDRDYLKALIEPAPARKAELFASAAKSYRKAIDLNGRLLIHYFTPEPVIEQLLPSNISKEDVKSFAEKDVTRIVDAIDAIVRSAPANMAGTFTDSAEYLTYIHRAKMRLEMIGKGS